MPRGGDYNIRSDNASADSIQQQSNMQAVVLGGIAISPCWWAVSGIMNIMLVTVTERTRRSASWSTSAERRSIITQFLIEAAVICGIGGLLGIGLGYIGTLIAGRFLLDGTLLLPSTPLLWSLPVSVVLGVLFGMYPAIKGQRPPAGGSTACGLIPSAKERSA